MRRSITLACATTAIVVGGATAATAAPPSPEVLELECSNGQTYTVEVRGNGAFTPGHIIGSTGVLIPTAFGPFTFTAQPPGGDPITVTDPTIETKGNGNAHGRERQTVTCTFSGTETLLEEAEGFSAGTVVNFTGTVTAFIPGSR
ncbi:hypothetical protein [Blastococcus sp. SYSU DS0973]